MGDIVKKIMKEDPRYFLVPTPLISTAGLGKLYSCYTERKRTESEVGGSEIGKTIGKIVGLFQFIFLSS
jgi:hypothetical protein